MTRLLAGGLDLYVPLDYFDAVLQEARNEELMSSKKPDHLNFVQIVGEISQSPQEIALPDGSSLVELRITVERPESGRDSLDIRVSEKSLMRRARSLRPGSTVAISGVLARRFWKGAAGVASRLEIEADSLIKVG